MASDAGDGLGGASNRFGLYDGDGLLGHDFGGGGVGAWVSLGFGFLGSGNTMKSRTTNGVVTMWLKTGLVVATMAVLSGCASQVTQKQAAPAVEYTFNSPEDTPREQWSTALLVAHELMGISGLKDVVAPEPVVGRSSGTQTWNGTDSLATGVLGAVSPTTHVSAGSSLALGAGLSMLSGGSVGPRGISQVAFWVPAELAGNAEEASQVAARTWTEARQRITGRHERLESVKTGAYPSNHPKNYATPKDTFMNNPTPFEGVAKKVAVAGLNGEFYGPIFIDRVSINVANDSMYAKLTRPELLARYAEELPEWTAIYFHASAYKEHAMPMTVVFKNQTHYFVAPPSAP